VSTASFDHQEAAMNRSIHTLILASALLGGAALAADLPSNRHAAAAEWRAAGFDPIAIKGFDLAYARPNAALGRYREISIAPIAVEFRRDTNTSLRDPLYMGPKDEHRVKERFARLVREELAAELAAGGYKIVDRAAPGVLEINAFVADLHLSAPDVRTAGRIEVYAKSFGEMTLVAELTDATTREPLLRIYDHARGFETTRLHHITQVETDAQARTAARGWARALRRELDTAHRATR
jgi:hypothetical protein